MFPRINPFAAVQRHQAIELCAQGLRVTDEMGVFVLQEFDPQRYRHFHPQAGAGAHRRHQRFRHTNFAHFFALRLDEHRARRVEPRQLRQHQALEHFLRRLRCIGQIAQHRTAMLGQVFEIEHLRTLGVERAQ